jgi:lysozyme
VISRRAVATIALSASALVALVLDEGYTSTAVVPVKGDVPTIGFGSTRRDDGTPVQMSDTITPEKALARALSDVQAFEGALKQCVTAPLSQGEYDVYLSFSYNIGSSAFCGSTLVKKLNVGDYSGACSELLRWRYVARRDCSVRSNNCYGLWLRRQGEYQRCMEAQQ